MKNFKKPMALLMALVLCIGLFAACTGGKDTPTEDTKEPTGTTAGKDEPTDAPTEEPTDAPTEGESEPTEGENEPTEGENEPTDAPADGGDIADGSAQPDTTEGNVTE